MPRKKLARRFEPRFGLSQPMVEIEAGYLAKEVEDYRRLSVNELKQMLEKRKGVWKIKDAELRSHIGRLSERDALILQSLLVRDCYHIQELYLAYLCADPALIEVTPGQPAVPEEVQTPFSEWLFGSR